MKRTLHLSIPILCLLFCHVASAQTVQLFQEGFNAGNSTFTLNAGGPASNTGPNQWIVNSQYNGNGFYPNTTSETITSGDTIALPDSNYLHIYDTTTASEATNCNYSTSSASDCFAYMSSGICTHGFTNVNLSFFYVAQGDSDSNGSVYYSLDGSNWTACGALKYYNDTVWNQANITLPAFANNYNLQFGFRWTNAGNGGPNKMSFGIDDILITASYSPIIPLQISVTAVLPDTMCTESVFKLQYNLSVPFCDGTYQIIMSDAQGGFTSDTTFMGSFGISSGDTSGYVTDFAPIGPLPTPNCYKFRIDRAATPYIKGLAETACVVINNCSNTTTALQPVATYGPDTTCDESAIDIPFYSTGTFPVGNVYIAQLSDSAGSFEHPQVIGTLTDTTAYDPYELFSIAGDIPGDLPVTATGCNYYIRVVSTHPAYNPAPNGYFGPFCIRHCDITTNNGKDLQVCLTDTVGAVDTVSFKINSWNKSITYGPGNKFEVQLVNTYSGNVISTVPLLGSVTTDSSASLVLRIPPYDSLFSLYFLFPNTYYLRIISTNSSSQTDTLGTLVRLTIGYHDDVVPQLGAYDTLGNPNSVYCDGNVVQIYVNNQNLLSDYVWKTNLDFGVGDSFEFQPPLGIEFGTAAPIGRFWFLSSENNNGCLSGWSDTLWISTLTPPSSQLSVSSSCLGDTVSLSIPLVPLTTYTWTVFGADNYNIIEDAQNQFKILFDSTGTYRINLSATNQCGGIIDNHSTTVSPQPVAPILNPEINGVHDTIAHTNELLDIYVTNVDSGQVYTWESSLPNAPLTLAYSPLQQIFGSKEAEGLYWFIAEENFNGCYSAWSDTVWIYYGGPNGIASVNANEQIHLSPNPTSGNVLISIPQQSGFKLLQLTDVTGRLISSQPVTQTNTLLNMDELPAGIYFVKLSGVGSSVFKVVKE